MSQKNKLKTHFTYFLFTLFTLSIYQWIVPSPSLAVADLNNKKIGIDAVAGLPQLLGLELSYLDLGPFVPGISFGSLPINSLLKKSVNLQTVPMNLGLSDTYNIYPSANFSLNSFSAFIKYFFGNSGFFTALIYSQISFGATIQADLKNETTGGISSNAISGSASLSQGLIGLGTGYQLTIGSSFFMQFVLGAGYLLPPKYSISLGGTAASALSVLPSSAEQAFDDAKSNIQTSFDSAMSSYRDVTHFMPFSFLNFGVAF